MARTEGELPQQARSIFDSLGYDVRGEGREFRAVRDRKEVAVAATGNGEFPDSGSLRCVVAPAGRADEVARSVRREAPPCEWAVIGVGEGGYEVVRAP